MAPDTQTLTDAAEAIRALNRRLAERDGPGYKASPEDLAAAVLSTIPEASVEEAPVQVMRLEDLTRDEATFKGAALSVTITRGEWVERERPTTLYLCVLDDHPMLSAPV